jgi:AraC family transcriptional regulator, transcriptional activator of pobA
VDQDKAQQRAPRPEPAPVPRFFLYGEPLQQVDASFVHVETIAHRSRRYQWRIRAHVHSDLDQLLFIRRGGGTMQVDGRALQFQAPALLLIPATVVHGFQFARDTRGFVVTAAEPLVRALRGREPELRRVFAAPACLDLAAAPASAAELEWVIDRLRRETVWEAPANRLAAESGLAWVLITALRHLPVDPGNAITRSPMASLVDRFRDLLDERCRSAWSLARYARELSVSPARLRAACVAVSDKPPRQLLHERVLLEARRTLTYSDLTVAQTAYQLGFSDPGYFSRFFSRHTGESPQAFRNRTAHAGDA